MKCLFDCDVVISGCEVVLGGGGAKCVGGGDGGAECGGGGGGGDIGRCDIGHCCGGGDDTGQCCGGGGDIDSESFSPNSMSCLHHRI
jgi:hypothetical protein